MPGGFGRAWPRLRLSFRGPKQSSCHAEAVRPRSFGHSRPWGRPAASDPSQSQIAASLFEKDFRLASPRPSRPCRAACAPGRAMNAHAQPGAGLPPPLALPEPPPRRRGRRLLLAGLLLVAVAGGAGWWARSAPPAVVYDTAPVVRRDLENAVTASGRIEPAASVDVGAQVSGQLRWLHVAAGDRVAAGQLLAEIDAEVQAAQVEGLQAELARLAAERRELQTQLGFAERQAGRHSSLAGRSSSRVTLEEAERDRDVLRARIEALDATIRRSRAELRAEEATLARSRITSPMAGTVVAVEAREGQTLNANYDTPVILRIADLATMTVRSDVSEADVVHLRTGMPVWFTTLGFPDRKYRAALRQVLPAPPVKKDEAANAVVTYVALFDVANAGGELLSGMTAQVFFVTESAEGVLAVPAAALDEGGAVRVLGPGGAVETRRPQIGLRTRSHVAILSGLAEGEPVVTGTRAPEGEPLLRIAP